MKGRVLFGIVVSTLLVTMLFSEAGAAGDKNSGEPIKMGESNSIIGYCFYSPQSDDASVEAYLTIRPNEIVTDRVGVSGLSGTPEMWMFDAGNFRTNWENGDVARIVVSKKIGNIGYTTSYDQILSSGGFPPFLESTITQMVSPVCTFNGVSVSLSWAAPQDAARIAGYLVYRSTNNATWTLLPGSGAVNTAVAGWWWSNSCTMERATSWTTTLYYNDSTVTAGNTYFYALRYVYSGTTGNGVPTNTHGSTGLNNPQGTWSKVCSAGSKPVDIVAPTANPTPANDSTGVPPTQPYIISFSEQMNTSSGSVSIWPAPSTLGAWTWSANGMYYNYTGMMWAWGTTYVNLTGFTDLAGNPLAHYKWWFTVPGPPILPPSDVSCHKSGYDILIDWTTGTGPFDILRSNDFTGSGFATIATGVMVMNYLDVGALVDPFNHSYIVRAAGSTLNSNMGFKLRRSLVDNGLANNWVALPYKTDNTTADSVMNDINSAITGSPNIDAVDKLTKWDTATQGYVSRVDMGAVRVGTNFAIIAGTGYQVHMKAGMSGVWTIVGAAQNAGANVGVSLVENILAYTWIALPYNCNLTTADNVMDQINIAKNGAASIDACNILTQWNDASQGYVTRVDIGASRIGSNFEILPGYGYQVHMKPTMSFNWTISNYVVYP